MKKSKKSEMMIDDEIIKLRGELVKLVDLEDKIRHHDSEIKSWEHWIKENGSELERLESERLKLSLLIERQKGELQKNIIERKNLAHEVPKHGKSAHEMLKEIEALQQKLKRGGVKGKNKMMI